MNERRITLAYGENEAEMTHAVLQAAGLAGLVPPGARVGIKPNLVLASPCEEGATTSPRIVAALIQHLQAAGHHNLTILEGAWVGASTAEAFRVCGYEALSRRYGVPLVDLQRSRCEAVSAGGLTMEISRSALDIDFLIDVPVMKGHCQTRITGALKNLKGCISNAEKRRFHTLGLHRPIACLAAALPVHFVLVDGMCGDLDFEEGGNPVPMHRIFAGRDPVQIDAYMAREMGYAPGDIEYIGLAEALGVGSTALRPEDVVVVHKSAAPAPAAQPGGKVARLAGMARPESACSACYANLIRALSRLPKSHAARLGAAPVCIGQGYRGQAGSGTGVGQCTAGLARSLPGCPPSAADILAFLSDSSYS